MTKEKLTKEAWIAAGFRALAESGPSALQINLLAKVLSATKGSFYWHFQDMADYRAALLETWRAKAATDIIQDMDNAASPWEQFEMLLLAAAKSAPEEYGGHRIETAMRAWALADPAVSDALASLDKVRMDILRQLLGKLGIDNPALAELAYATYIGLDDLQSRNRGDMKSAIKELKSLIRQQLPSRLRN